MIEILAVDDDEGILRVMEKALSKEGYAVTAVSEPLQIEHMDLNRYQLILLDVMMPGMDGFTLVEKIRERVDCPILFVTAKTEELRYGGEVLNLTKSEYRICEYLALNRGQVFSKEQIYEYVFGFDGESDSSAITEHVKNIRGKCKKAGFEPIETVWGIGYRWNKEEA